jgi:hypothetical protein
MTDETVECFNCGRPNPDWAQVCRSCGVALRHGESRVQPAGPFPTDRDSLLSIGAVVATIIGAVLLGLFVSSLNPTDPTIGRETPTPEPTLEPTPTPEPTPEEPTPEPTPDEPTPEPEPELPGELAFGEELDETRRVAETVETFTPSMTFAYSVTVEGGFGGPQIFNEVARVQDGEETIVLEREGVDVDPAADNFGYVIGQAGSFVQAWGPGQYVWRVYVGDDLVAEETFRLSEG